MKWQVIIWYRYQDHPLVKEYPTYKDAVKELHKDIASEDIVPLMTVIKLSDSSKIAIQHENSNS